MKRLHLERLANPQLLALAAVLLINWLLFPNFFRVTWQDGRLFGSLHFRCRRLLRSTASLRGGGVRGGCSFRLSRFGFGGIANNACDIGFLSGHRRTPDNGVDLIELNGSVQLT